MIDKLPDLPEPFVGTKFIDRTNVAYETFEFYDADQMREYALAAITAAQAEQSASVPPKELGDSIPWVLRPTGRTKAAAPEDSNGDTDLSRCTREQLIELIRECQRALLDANENLK